MITPDRIKALKEKFQAEWCVQEANELFDEIDRLKAEKNKVKDLIKDLKEWVLETGFSDHPETYVQNHLQTIQYVFTLVTLLGIDKKD